MSSSPRSNIVILAYLALAIGVALIGLGAFYFTTDTSFLASDFGRHPTHAFGSTGLGIALIVAGIIVWLRTRKEKPQENHRKK